MIEDIEAAISANLKRLEWPRLAIYRKAFANKLVPQELDDEPAAALLQRIRAERVASAPVKKSISKSRGRGRKSEDVQHVLL